MNDVISTGNRLSSRNQATLAKIEDHPTSGNIKWRDVLSLLAALGDVTERHDGKYAVVLPGGRTVLHPPKGKDIEPEQVADLRRLLSGAPSGGGTESVPAGEDAVVALDYHRARIFDIAAASSSGLDVAAPDPWELNRHLHHKYYFEHGHYDLDEADTHRLFEAVYDGLTHFRRVLVVGHGKGKADAAAAFEQWWAKHHRETVGTIAGTETADIDDITNAQLLRWAEDYFGADQPERE